MLRRVQRVGAQQVRGHRQQPVPEHRERHAPCVGKFFCATQQCICFAQLLMSIFIFAQGNEYLCPLCRVKLPLAAVSALLELDKSGIFHYPITTDIAKTYFDVIRNPMDLQTMRAKAERGQYKALQTLRADFELMCLNALTFNKPDDEYWAIARLFHHRGVAHFASCKRATTCSAYGLEVRDLLKLAKQSADGFPPAPLEEKPRPKKAKRQKERDAGDDYKKAYIVHSSQKHDRSRGSAAAADSSSSSSTLSSYSQLFDDEVSTKKRQRRGDAPLAMALGGAAGGAVVSSALQPDIMEPSDPSASQPMLLAGLPTALHAGPPFSTAASDSLFFFSLQQTLRALLPFDERVVGTDVAFYTCCRDACSICASAGSPEHFLFCRDCGECFHSFCVDAPLPLMLQQEARLASQQRRSQSGSDLRPVAPRSRWKCSACSMTCTVCHLAACRSPSCPPPPHVSPQEGLRLASVFVACSVCEAIAHVGCVPFLSATGWDRLAGGGESWVCCECCACVSCPQWSVASKSSSEVATTADATTQFLEDRVGDAFFATRATGKSRKCWGFSTEQCLRCDTREYFLRRPSTACDESTSLSRHSAPGLQWAPSCLQLAPEDCGHCKQGLLPATPSANSPSEILCCALCFRVFHSNCCAAEARLGELFACAACRRSEHVLMNGFSHVGTGQHAAVLLQTISDIQLVRKRAAVAASIESIGGPGQPSVPPPRPTPATLIAAVSFQEKKRMLMLMVLVAWASRRCHFMSRSSLLRQVFGTSPDSCSSSSGALFSLNRAGNASVSQGVRAQSVQFLRLWCMLDGGGEAAEEAHKMALMQGT